MAIYVSQAGSGTQTGDEFNKLSLSGFDALDNSATIPAGETVIFCGTFSTGTTFDVNTSNVRYTGDANLMTQSNTSDIPLWRFRGNNIQVDNLAFAETHGAALQVQDVVGGDFLNLDFQTRNRKSVRLAGNNTDIVFQGLTMDYIDPGAATQDDDHIVTEGAGSTTNLTIRNSQLLNSGHSGINLGIFGHVTNNVYIYDCEALNPVSPYGRFFDTKLSVTNAYIARCRTELMRAPNQIGGGNINMYNCAFLDQRDACRDLTNGCSIVYSDAASTTFFGSGQVIAIVQGDVQPGATYRIINTTINGADLSALNSAEAAGSLVLINNLWHDVMRRPGSSVATRNDFAIWIQDLVANLSLNSNNIYVPGQTQLYSEGDPTPTTFDLAQINAASPVSMVSGANNSSHDAALDALGRISPTSLSAGAGQFVAPLVDPAGLLPADLNLCDAMAADWTYQNGNSVKRGALWDQGAYHSSASQLYTVTGPLDWTVQ